MSEMSQFWFTSPRFQVEVGEDEETNPGRFGRQLARWLADALHDAGYPEAKAEPEDWGWRIRCERKPVELSVNCGNVGDEPTPDGEGVLPEASSIVWHCFVSAEPGLLQRLFKSGNAEPAISRLSKALEGILVSEPSITLVEEQ